MASGTVAPVEESDSFHTSGRSQLNKKTNTNRNIVHVNQRLRDYNVHQNPNVERQLVIIPQGTMPADARSNTSNIIESLILAQDERWRRG